MAEQTGDEKAHALLSPSSSARWLACPGSADACRDIPNTTSAAAEEGTKAHAVAAEFLEEWLRFRRLCQDQQDWANAVRSNYSETTRHPMWPDLIPYVDAVHDRCAPSSVLLVEHTLDLYPITGEEGAVGTADAIVITQRDDGASISVMDLKFGRGEKVSAEENSQLAIYLLAALEEFSFLDFDEMELVISQPRIHTEAESWFVTQEWLDTFRDEVKRTAAGILSGNMKDRNPGEKQCRWCRFKVECPELSAQVARETGIDFDLTDLSEKRKAVALIEDWCRAVCAEVENRIKAGEQIQGWKLVQGREGNRSWASKDYDELIKMFKAARLRKDAYAKPAVYSPTEIERIIGPRGTQPDEAAWEKLQKSIVRPAGSLTVVPDSDKRAAVKVETEDFKDLGD